MAEHIPFVGGKESCNLVAKYYADSEIIRVPLEPEDSRCEKLPLLGKQSRLWIDPRVDGLDDIDSRGGNNPWFVFMSQFSNFEKLGSRDFWAKPNAATVEEFVNGVLNACLAYTPSWITVPQLPIEDSSRNRMNRELAKATAKWKSASGFVGKLIFPVVITNQKQINLKTERNPRVKQAARCYAESNSEGLWVVDKSLDDDSGSKTLRQRLPSLIDFHKELNDEIRSSIRVAGPYWGMNFVLWARGLVDYPAIGIGSGYQYSLAGGHPQTPSPRIAIVPLRRRTKVVPQLGKWVDQSLNILGPTHPAAADLQQLRKSLPLLSGPETARGQLAKFYKHWYDRIALHPKAGRSLALFQDLSAAFALGKALPILESEGTARRAESVVEPLMLNSL